MGRVVVTKSGKRLTEADLDRIADRFEEGFDLSTWVPRRAGRPRLEPGALEHSPRIEVRVPASLHRRVQARATADGRTVSQVVRSLLQDYVERR